MLRDFRELAVETLHTIKNEVGSESNVGDPNKRRIGAADAEIEFKEAVRARGNNTPQRFERDSI
jgi:hypothetical protein